MEPMNYEANSHRSKQEESRNPERQRAEKVVKGAVTKKKKTVGSKVAEDANNVKTYLLRDILIPSAKKLVVDLVINGIEGMVYGSNPRGADRRDRTLADRVSYDKQYRRYDDRYPSEPRTRSKFDYDDIEFKRKDDAETVLTRLDEMIETYGQARVSDLYDLIGESCDYTYNSYGWTNLSTARVVPYRGVYMLDMPRPLPLRR